MITTLPANTKAVDAEPDRLASSAENTTASASQPGLLSQEELALLLTSGDTRRIREALPRMSPDIRRVAELMLAEASAKQDK